MKKSTLLLVCGVVLMLAAQQWLFALVLSTAGIVMMALAAQEKKISLALITGFIFLTGSFVLMGWRHPENIYSLATLYVICLVSICAFAAVRGVETLLKP